MSAPAASNPEVTGRPGPVRDKLQASVENWHGVANAASVALFGVSFIHTTSAARAAWWEVSNFVLSLSQTRKPTPRA
jgi:hypothetical protein